MSSSNHPRKTDTKHSRLKKTTVTVGVCSTLISGVKDKDKGIGSTVCLSPASDPTAGLEAESLVYVVKLQHTIAELHFLYVATVWTSSFTEKPVCLSTSCPFSAIKPPSKLTLPGSCLCSWLCCFDRDSGVDQRELMAATSACCSIV